MIAVDPPRTLPVEHLSVTSLRLLSQCPERWRRRYLEREYEPPTGRMVLGSAAGAAEAQHFWAVLEGGAPFDTAQVVDEFDSQWKERVSREEVDWQGQKPGALKDAGVAALEAFHPVALTVEPVSVERQFSLSWEGLDWSLVGYIDVEDRLGRVRDIKLRAKRLSQREADVDLQASVYLAARAAEGDPAPEFCFDTMIRPTARSAAAAEVIVTRRSPEQLAHVSERVLAAAAEIQWRAEHDCWTGAAPGTWFCATCSYRDCRWRLG